jgi:protoporphyrinogen oxidase
LGAVDMSKKCVAVIGGGCTGVAAATSLVQKGYSVTLFEKNSFLGGLAAGFKKENWNCSLEHFYHHWFKSDNVVLEYAKIWGVEKNIVFKRPTTVSQTSRHGFVQLDSPLSLLSYPELSIVHKLRMACALAFLKILPNGKFLEKYTAVAWCERYMGVNGFNSIWRPLLEGKFGAKHLNDVNMAWLWARIKCRTAELGTYEGGFAKLFLDVEQWLLNHGVKVVKNLEKIEVEKKENTWLVHGMEFSHVVAAVEPNSFSNLFKFIAPRYCASLNCLPSLGVQVVVLSLKNSLGKNYWYSLRKSNQNTFLAAIEHTNFVSVKEFGGENIVYLADYVHVGSNSWLRSNDQLLILAYETCKLIMPSFTPNEVTESWFFRSSYAQPIMGVNASKNIPSYEVNESECLYHASMAHVYPWDRGTNFAFEAGKRVAELI